MRGRCLLVTAVLALGLAAPGCGDDDEDAASTQPTAAPPAATTRPPATTPGRGSALRVYLLRGEDVTPVARSVPATRQVAAAAMRELLQGPTGAERAAGLTTAVPPGTGLLGVTLRDATATVDLTRRFEAGGGSLSMTSRVAQVVATLTAFPTVRRVAMRLDGESVRTVGGEGVPVAPPLTRADIEDRLPQILVESPLRGERVGSPLRVTGSSNTFEATSVVELRGPDGEQLAKEAVTATSGSGQRGTFAVTLRFEPPPSARALTLFSYAPSAQDGSPQHAVRIPLRAR
ncbi:MAG TPA: GerMN domain-containing protein [Baekduia sp.]|nr:GerMN domain-containing protein [Baekduia sp.]